MNQLECVCCRQPSPDGATLCEKGCTVRLRTELRSIPELVEDLHTMLARQDRLTARQNGHGAETPEPWKDQASRALADLHSYLSSWVLCIAEDTGLSTERLMDTSPGCAAWLLHHLPIVRRHSAAADLLAEVKASAGRGRVATDLPQDRTRFPVGPCPQLDQQGEHCPGQVWAYVPTVEDDPAWLRCRTCTAKWDTTQWRRAGACIAARRHQLNNQVSAQ